MAKTAAAYNHYVGPKKIDVWAYSGHEGGAAFQCVRQMRFLGAARGHLTEIRGVSR